MRRIFPSESFGKMKKANAKKWSTSLISCQIGAKRVRILKYKSVVRREEDQTFLARFVQGASASGRKYSRWL